MSRRAITFGPDIGPLLNLAPNFSLEPSEPNYAEADKVTSVDYFHGLKFIGHKDVPDNEIHLVQHGKCVGKIINLVDAT